MSETEVMNASSVQVLETRWLLDYFEFAPEVEREQLGLALQLISQHYEKQDKNIRIWDVARLLVEHHSDRESVLATLLFPLVTDQHLTSAQVDARFSPAIKIFIKQIKEILDLFDKTSELSLHLKEKQFQNELLRRMILAAIADVRVIAVCLAERLVLLRQAKILTEDQRRQLAAESMTIYAPLANRLGMGQLKWEMEDWAFRYLNPAQYQHIAKLLREKRENRENYIQEIIQALDTHMKLAGISASITGRPKHIYSIWRKMSGKNQQFEDLSDIRAVRILVSSVMDCYAALGIVHTLWAHIPGEFDDYIATPKENLYQSIHTALIGPGGKTVEVQIRTRDMHEHAEYGIAAHWKYKEGKKHDVGLERKIAWLRNLLENRHDQAVTGPDLLDRFQEDTFQDKVYVITPKGEIVGLPKGATPLDFAYHVHTEVGHRCRGVKVNGKLVPLQYELKNGERAEIMLAKTAHPSRDWLNPHFGYLKTERARHKVRDWFNKQDFRKNVSAGRVLLDKELKRLHLHDENYETLAQAWGLHKVDDFLALLGKGEITPLQVIHRLHPPAARDDDSAKIHLTERSRSTAGMDQSQVSIYGVGNLLTQFAKCCKPIVGDAIIGYFAQGKGVVIHKQNCANILRIPSHSQNRLIQVEWGSNHGQLYDVDIQLISFDRQGLLRDVSALLSNEKINVIAVQSHSQPKKNKVVMQLTIQVSDLGQLSHLLALLLQIPNVLDVKRQVS